MFLSFIPKDRSFAVLQVFHLFQIIYEGILRILFYFLTLQHRHQTSTHSLLNTIQPDHQKQYGKL